MVQFVDVVLIDAGADKIRVIHVLRDVTGRERQIKLIDLRTAKRLTDSPPCVVVANVPLEVGERVKASLETAGAAIELKPA